MRYLSICAVSFALSLLFCPLGQAKTNSEGIYFAARTGVGIAQVSDLDFDLGPMSFTLDADEGTDVAGMFGLAIGWDFNRSSSSPMRLELEFMHMGEAELKWRGNVTVFGNVYDERFHGDLSVTTFFLNYYYDFHGSSRVTPFLNAGLGLAMVKLSVEWYDHGYYMGEESDTNTNLALNIGGGVGFSLTDNASLDLSYRFAYLGPTGVDAEYVPVEIEAQAWRHDILLGIRYTF